MSGCYRCGLPEGGNDRLCETCFRMRFYRGRDVVDLPAEVAPEGLEFSPRMRTVLLSSGAMLYASLVGLFVVAHAYQHARTEGDPRLEFYADSEFQSVVRLEQELGDLHVRK